MDWTSLTAAKVMADFPTDALAEYTAWLAANPDKENRLAEITTEVIAEFRDVLAAVGYTLPETADQIPTSCVRHAETLIFSALYEEFGHTFTSAETSALLRAEMALRQLSYRKPAVDPATIADPIYTVPESNPERSLPS